MKILAFVDIETTGLDETKSDIWEVGVIKTASWLVYDIFQSYYSVRYHIPAELQAQSNMKEEILTPFPHLHEKRDELRQFLAGAILIAYNVPFERKFLTHHGVISNDSLFVDIYPWVKEKRFPTPNNKLQTILKYLGLNSSAPHRALNDALALYSLVVKFNWFDRINRVYVNQDSSGVETGV